MTERFMFGHPVFFLRESFEIYRFALVGCSDRETMNQRRALKEPAR